MPTSKLFRRREVWLPTLPGAALLLALAALGLWAAVHGVYPYLAETAPVGRGLFVVEGWLPDHAIKEAIDRFQRGGYELFVAAGGPVEDAVCPPGFATYAERAASLARGLGVGDEQLAVVPAPASAQDRTFRSAVSVRQWATARRRTVAALDVYSYGPHARRTRWLYQRAFGDSVAVGVIAGAPRSYDPETWWRTSEGGRTVVAELLAWAWTRLFFHPGARGSWHEEWGAAAAPPRARTGREEVLQSPAPHPALASLQATDLVELPAASRDARGRPAVNELDTAIPASRRARKIPQSAW